MARLARVEIAGEDGVSIVLTGLDANAIIGLARMAHTAELYAERNAPGVGHA